MTVERIQEAILAQARAEAEKIEAEARQDHDKRLAADRQRIEAEYERRYATAEQTARQDSERQVLRRRSGHNLALLRKRNSILDDLFAKAADRFASASEEQYTAAVRQWMTELPSAVGGELLCNQRDAQRLGPLVTELNASRPPEGQLGLVPGDRPERGGVIFRTEKFEIDLSVDARIADLREELAPQVAEILFPEDDGV